MLELREIATVFSGVPARESKNGIARLMRLADLTDVKAGRVPAMVRGEPPEVARALPIEDGDLIVAARGSGTDVCTASDCIVGAYISLDLYLVRPQPKRINSEYLRAVLELPATQAVLAREKQGSGLARLPKEALEKTAIPVRPLHQQRLIAGLALSLEHEQKLLKKLGELKDRHKRVVLGRAIRGAEANFSRRSV
jgi:restriction endonuclease S subunit